MVNESDFAPILLDECPECHVCGASYMDVDSEWDHFCRAKEHVVDCDQRMIGGLVYCDSCRKREIARQPNPGRRRFRWLALLCERVNDARCAIDQTNSERSR